MVHTLVCIGVMVMIFVLEVIYVAIWTLVLCKDDDFDEALFKSLIFLLLLFTVLFSYHLTDKIIDKNDIGIISETVSDNGG